MNVNMWKIMKAWWISINYIILHAGNIYMVSFILLICLSIIMSEYFVIEYLLWLCQLLWLILMLNILVKWIILQSQHEMAYYMLIILKILIIWFIINSGMMKCLIYMIELIYCVMEVICLLNSITRIIIMIYCSYKEL